MTIAAHERGFFTEETSADVVIARNAQATDARLKAVMAVLIRHLHAAVKEIEPTQDEWMQAIRFLTDTGHMCTDWRQEFILL
ncbi:MAG: dioxygenase, partial [Gemmobacter sp.]